MHVCSDAFYGNQLAADEASVAFSFLFLNKSLHTYMLLYETLILTRKSWSIPRIIKIRGRLYKVRLV